MKIIIVKIIQFLAKLAVNFWAFAMFVVESEDVMRALYAAGILALVIYLVVIWTKYLNSGSETRTEVIVYTCLAAIAGSVLVFFAFPLFTDNDELAAGVTGQYTTLNVDLVAEDGMYRVPTLLNDSIVQYFLLDSGASDIQLTPDVFSAMCRSGAIVKCADLPRVPFMMADGSVIHQRRVVLDKVEIGGVVFHDVKASVSEDDSADLLMGQSILSRAKSYHIDNKKHVLKMYIPSPT